MFRPAGYANRTLAAQRCGLPFKNDSYGEFKFNGWLFYRDLRCLSSSSTIPDENNAVLVPRPTGLVNVRGRKSVQPSVLRAEELEGSPRLVHVRLELHQLSHEGQVG